MAGPPSPVKPERPSPAIVLMIPAVFTLRMRWLSSAMKMFPELSTAMPSGSSDALVAGPPSPEDP